MSLTYRNQILVACASLQKWISSPVAWPGSLVSQHPAPDAHVGRNFSISSFCLLLFATNALSSKKHQASSPASPPCSPPRAQSQKTLTDGSFESHRIADRAARVASPDPLFPLRVGCPLRVSFLSCLDHPSRRWSHSLSDDIPNCLSHRRECKAARFVYRSSCRSTLMATANNRARRRRCHMAFKPRRTQHSPSTPGTSTPRQA